MRTEVSLLSTFGSSSPSPLSLYERAAIDRREDLEDLLERFFCMEHSVRLINDLIKNYFESANQFSLHISSSIKTDSWTIFRRNRTAFERCLARLKRQIHRVDPSIRSPEMTSRYISDFREQYRWFLHIFGALATSFDWQTIAYESSVRPNIFRFREYGCHGVLGYKRVHYPALYEFEDGFLKNFYDTPHDKEYSSLLTSSGMGAYTTVEGLLIRDCLEKGDTIVYSSRCYFETRDQLSRLRGFSIVPTESNTTNDLIEAVKHHQPRVLFVEPVTNEETIRVVDIPRLLRALNDQEYDRDTFCIIDLSMCGGGIQPLVAFDHSNPHLHIILIESLLKYRQHGTDKVNAGIIVCDKKFFRHLFVQRERTGTILPDVQLAMFPRVSRRMHEWRMRRIHRNAELFARQLKTRLSDLPTCQVNSPLLDSHPDAALAQKYNWLGGVITLGLASKGSVPLYLKVIETILSGARNKSIEIHHGTSFGFDVTRVAVAATGGGSYTSPFLRFSIGIEPIDRIVELVEIAEAGIRYAINQN